MSTDSKQNLAQTLFSAAQVRTMDSIAINQYGIPGIELMTRAGYAVFAQLRERWPSAKKLCIFCGAGNNAGDGYIIARLAKLAGLQVRLFSLIDHTQLHGDALTAAESFIAAGGDVTSFQHQTLDSDSVLVDALFGTGLSRPVQGEFAAAIDQINHSHLPVIAVDIPSGIHADTGNVMGCAVKADCTVSFIGLKQGLFTGDAAEYCGDIVYDALQLPTEFFQDLPDTAKRVTKTTLPRRDRTAHKGKFGHVLLVGGDTGYTGAIRLAAEAALRSGAGLVSVATRAQHSAFINLARPEMMCHAVETVEQLEPLLQRANVIVLGPGLGRSNWSRNLFARIMKTKLPCVVDADGLNWLAEQPHHHENWVLTPHPGEAARLLSTTTATISQDRYSAVTALQQKYGGICILKGAGTLIKSDQTLFVSTTGNPGMASGGMGDVLSGVIGALIAQGLTLTEAANIGVYTHGLAADLLAQKNGERGLLANDLVPTIRKLLNS